MTSRHDPKIRTHPHRSVTWQDHAVCVDYDPEIWFNPNRVRDALAICASCPVRKPCTQLGRSQRDGVWGGRVHQTSKRKEDVG